MRTFVAIALDSPMHAALSACLSRLQAARPPLRLRWVPPDNQHLTLQFLGEIAESSVEAVTAALHAAVHGIAPFELALAQTGCFPNAARPNVLWAGVSDPSAALAGLQQSVVARLRPLGFEAERGPFQPHLTLARLPRDARPAERRAVGEWFSRQPPPAPAAMRVAEIRLMLSDLRPGEPRRYTPLAVIPLSANNANLREQNREAI